MGAYCSCWALCMSLSLYLFLASFSIDGCSYASHWLLPILTTLVMLLFINPFTYQMWGFGKLSLRASPVPPFSLAPSSPVLCLCTFPAHPLPPSLSAPPPIQPPPPPNILLTPSPSPLVPSHRHPPRNLRLRPTARHTRRLTARRQHRREIAPLHLQHIGRAEGCGE